MKRFTLTLMGFLLLLGGTKVCAQTETLYLNGGANWNATDGTNSWGSYSGSSVTYTAGDVTINGFGRNLGMTGLTGSNWCASFTVDVVKLQTVGMLALSTNNGIGEGGSGNPSGADSRSSSFDDED